MSTQDQTPKKQTTPAKKHKRNPLALKLGYGIFALALIGSLAVLTGAYRLLNSILDNTKEVEKYQNYLRPVVMFDPVPFSTPENADPNFVLQAAMWSALLGENRNNYAYDDIGLVIVPASDLDVEAAKLFGPKIKLTHRTFDDYEASYLYEHDIKAYHVPIVQKVSYSPKVEKIVKKGNSIVLTVGYVPPANIWTTDITKDTNTVAPDKYMNYEIVKDKKSGDYIKAVRDIEATQAPRS